VPVSKEFESYVVEQFSAAGAVDSRRMFGGVGLYLDDVFCALIDSTGRVYLRVGDSNRADFEAEGMRQFRPRSTGAAMPYFEVPAGVLEDQDALRSWALEARSAAVAASETKGKASRRKRARS
jgi:DNA transformation protein